MRPKISHFWSPNFRVSRFGAKKRGEGEEEEEKFAKGMELSKDFYDFWYGSLVLYGISMVLGMELSKDF